MSRSDLWLVSLMLAAGAFVLGAPLLGRAGWGLASNVAMGLAAVCGVVAFAVAAAQSFRSTERRPREYARGSATEAGSRGFPTRVLAGTQRQFFAAAYRPFFLVGALHAVLVVGLWFGWIESIRTGAAWSAALAAPPAWAHADAMVFGTLTFFVFGFLGTAFPRWVGAPPPTPGGVGLWLALLLGGQLALAAGLVVGPVAIVLFGLLEAAAFLAMLAFLVRALRRGRGAAWIQPGVVAVAPALGLVGVALAAGALLKADLAWQHAAESVGLEGYLLLLVLGVAGRIVPFFTSRVLGREHRRRPSWLFGGLLALVLLRVALAVAGLAPGRVAAAADVLLAAVLLREAVLWRPGRALRDPMIGILFLGWGWIVLGLMGAALGDAVPPLAAWLRFPWLHALAVGGFSTLVIGLSARVVLGHGGRPIAANAGLIAAFVAIQLAAVTRVVLPLLGSVASEAPLFAPWAAVFWCAAFVLWLVTLTPRLLASVHPS